MPEATYMRAAFHYSQEDHAEALSGFRTTSQWTKASRAPLGAKTPGILDDLTFLVDYHRHEDLPPPLPIPHEPKCGRIPMLAPDGTMLFYTRIEAFKAKGDVT